MRNGSASSMTSATEIAPPHARFPERTRHHEGGLPDLGVRPSRLDAVCDEDVTLARTRRVVERLGKGSHPDRHRLDRTLVRRVISATTCATVRTAGTSSSRDRDAEAILQLANQLEDLQRIESQIGDEIVCERRLDRAAADFLEHLHHRRFDLGGGRLGHGTPV